MCGTDIEYVQRFRTNRDTHELLRMYYAGVMDLDGDMSMSFQAQYPGSFVRLSIAVEAAGTAYWEDKLNYEEKHLIYLNQNKIIYNEKRQPTCKIHSRILSETIETIERTAVTQTIEELTQKTAITEEHKN